ncbi:MAG: hypothetical protein GY764_14745 [Halieaceae bacterium]|nr:hypothetical protein [Halieaceae bacterium]
MFQPSPTTTVFIPYQQGPENVLGAVVNADYFGAVPPERLMVRDGVIYFKTDGRERGKIGVTPVVQDSGGRFSLHVISAVSPREDMHFSFIKLNSEYSCEPLAKLSLVGGQISNSHPVDANEYCSCILPKLVALFFSNHGGNRKFSARGSTTRAVWRVFQNESGS